MGLFDFFKRKAGTPPVVVETSWYQEKVDEVWKNIPKKPKHEGEFRRVSKLENGRYVMEKVDGKL